MIKKILLACVALVVLRAHAETGETRLNAPSAETNETNPNLQTFHLAPVAGLTAMNLKGDETRLSPDIGGSIGFLTDIGGGTFALQTGLIYNEYAERADYLFWNAKLKMDYLSIPVFGKVNIMGNANRTVYLKAGLMPSFLTKKELTVSGMYFDESNTVRDLPFKTFDLPAVVGVGGAIRVARNKAVIVEGTYVRGLTNIVSDGSGNLHNEGIIISSGFAFGF